MGITPIIQPKPYLDLGTMVHQTLAYWLQNPTLTNTEGTTQSLRAVFLTIASQHRRGVITKYQNATGTQPTLEELAPLDDAITLGTAMMGNYQEYYKEPLPSHLRFCSPEQEMLLPIPGTEHYLKARLDALAQDTLGNLYVVENKTYDKRPDINLLEANDQFIGYIWAAQQFAKQLPTNPPVVGIAYNGLFKRAQPPRGKTVDDLFVRTIITPSQDEVDEYGHELAFTVKEMANDPYIYKNRQWSGCWDCSFEHLCRTQSQDGDVDFLLRTQFTKRVEEDTSDIVTRVEANPLWTV